MTPNARAKDSTSRNGCGNQVKSGPSSRATAGSPIQPMAREQSVTPSWDADMYWSSLSTTLAERRARALPCCASSSSCVFLMRTNAYSAATKNPFARTRAKVSPNATSALVSMSVRFSHLRYAHTVRVVVFLGTVRSQSRGKRILHLEYEAYAEMAEAKMREISNRLVREHGPLRIAMHHRVGDLAIGDIAVIVAAAAPHRDAAFAAARSAIDELKTIVPIWKKEHAEDGAVWIEEHA